MIIDENTPLSIVRERARSAAKDKGCKLISPTTHMLGTIRCGSKWETTDYVVRVRRRDGKLGRVFTKRATFLTLWHFLIMDDELEERYRATTREAKERM